MIVMRLLQRFCWKQSCQFYITFFFWQGGMGKNMEDGCIRFKFKSHHPETPRKPQDFTTWRRLCRQHNGLLQSLKAFWTSGPACIWKWRVKGDFPGWLPWGCKAVKYERLKWDLMAMWRPWQRVWNLKGFHGQISWWRKCEAFFV